MQTASLNMILSMGGYSNFMNGIAFETTQCPISSQSVSRSASLLLCFDMCDYSIINCCSLSFI